jgi:type II secretory pathway pseudopilin PulG
MRPLADLRGGADRRGLRPAVSAEVRAPRRRVDRARGGADEEGFTLVEGVVVVVVFAVLLAMTIPIVSTLYQTNSRVNTTYSNVNYQIWLSTTFQRLIRAAVAPDASFIGSKATAVTPPSTPFTLAHVTPTSVTFYTNTGTTRGPERVTAGCKATTSSPTYCAAPTSTFTVTITPAKSGTCPTTETSSAKCSWTTKTKHVLVAITHVKNGANKAPLFIYAYGSAPTLGAALTTTTVCFAAKNPTPCTSTYTDATVFSSTHCKAGTTAHPFANCPAGEIDDVTYDLQINGNTTNTFGGEQAEDATGVFVLSSTSMNFSPAVG